MSSENAELRKVGLKVTLPRVKIFNILETAEEHHLSAEDVYKKLLEQGDDVGLATVYRVLTQFEAAGLVLRHNFEGGHAVFEMAGDDHHDHMVCTLTMRSGTVVTLNLTRQGANDLIRAMPTHGQRRLAHGEDAHGGPYAVRLDCVASVVAEGVRHG